MTQEAIRAMVHGMKAQARPVGEIVASVRSRCPDLDAAAALELVQAVPEPGRPTMPAPELGAGMHAGELEAEIRARLKRRQSTARIVGDLLENPSWDHCTPAFLAGEVARVRASVETSKEGAKAAREAARDEKREAAKAAREAAKKARPSAEEEALGFARQVDTATGGELACFNPPETPRATPTFSRKQEDGAFRDIDPKDLQDLFNEAAGRPLSPSEFTLVSWFLASAVLHNRGSATIQTGLACNNGLITFDPPTWTPGRPEKPCQFTIPRAFIPDRGALPDPLALGIVQGWAPWGQDPLFLLEVIARVLLPKPAGDFLACFGPGGDGKSTFFEFIEALIGPGNVCRPNPSEFSKERRHRGVAGLRGKLLCLLDDVGEDVFQIMGTFLKEQPTAPILQGARLYEDPISFPNTATLAILGNRLPKRTDHSRGFFDRYHLSIWPNRIRSTAGDVADIEKKWALNAREMDLVFSLGVHLAWQFMESGRWYHHNDRQESEALSDALAGPEARFLWERFDRDPVGFLPWAEIEEAWRAWWPDYNNRPRFDRDVFLEGLSATWQGEAVRKQINRERYRGVVGLRIMPKGQSVARPEKPSIGAVFGNLGKEGGIQSGQKTPYFSPLSFYGKTEIVSARNESEKNESAIEDYRPEIWDFPSTLQTAPIDAPGEADPDGYPPSAFEVDL